MSNSLDQLKATGTVVVSDSGDFECKYAELAQFSAELTSSMQLSMFTSPR